ncbi:MAG TPA: hypothetical protein VL727_29350 [Puia sp.]|jgi:hypothetical protein|nr:hypothetical protein [Puia sp.]
MTTRQLLTALSALTILASCKKNSSTDLSGNTLKLKTYIEDVQLPSSPHLTDTFAVTYDNSNRITSLASANLKFLYTYSDKSFTLDLYQNNQLSIHELLYINSIPYLDSTFQFNNTNDSTTEKYVYNGKLLTHKTTYTYSKNGTTVNFRNDYTYDNSGNLIKDVETDGQGNINSTSTFTYTNNPLNVSVSPVYFPIQSKYFPATQKQTDGTGTPIATITYSYLFDNAGRVSKETDMADDGEVVIKTYIYY